MIETIIYANFNVKHNHIKTDSVLSSSNTCKDYSSMIDRLGQSDYFQWSVMKSQAIPNT